MDSTLNLPRLDVQGLLHRFGLRPDKHLGQNFLIDGSALKRVVEAAEVGPKDIVLEIGPGLGSLTRYLAIQAQQVVAVELDADLLPPLKHVLAPYSNVTIVEGDILSLDPARLMPKPGYLVVANIPYYITSALIRHLLEARHMPSRLVLTVQREVANRICAQPGDMSLLALSVQVYGQPKIVAQIPSGSFYPIPKIDSTIVRVDIYTQPAVPPEQLKTFFRLAKAGFSQKRKTLRNALSAGLAWPAIQAESLLSESNIDSKRRAETLSIQEWASLTEVFIQKQAS
jgi:16S rRNA (adenine1518-N6/adenine1519-N6)-dimethyltransferase